MGADAHIHIEVKFEDSEGWHHLNAIRPTRSYQMFEKMAGVRGQPEKAIVPPRGLPEDCTFVTRKDYERWAPDAHSMSWLSLEEIEELDEFWLEEVMQQASRPEAFIEIGFLHSTFLFGNGWRRDNPSLEKVGVEDVRWVFWFDN